jgi:formate dehydrogenase iron-sulfur subunit
MEEAYGAAGMTTTTAFFTDATLCIGCKACEVACKEWNGIAEDGFNWTGNSYDNTGSVGHSTWRHVKFVEHAPEPGLGGNNPELASWVFSSDVCKHCEKAGCLEACPTGAIVRTEFGGVFVQPDICNGCSYCVVACPFGVVQRNKEDGRAFKCTFCYDRQKVGLHPACSTACPTESIKFGPIEEMRLVAQERMQELQSRGMDDTCVYDPADTSVEGIHAMFLLRGDPRQYNLPPHPEVPTIYNKAGWTSSAVAAGLLLVGSLFAFLGSAKR